MTHGSRFLGRRQNSSFLRFLTVFVAYGTLFWVSETIFVASDCRCTIPGHTLKLVVFTFSGRFRGYSKLFWVPGMIFGARDPRLTVSGQMSKLVVFAFSGRFRGL